MSNVISFINMKGGVAKTTLAVNVADYLNRVNEERVLVIDADPQFNATQCMMSSKAYIAHLTGGKDTVASIFERPVRIVPSVVNGTEAAKKKEISDIEPYQIRENLFLLPGDLNLFRIEMSPGQGREFALKKFIDAICKKLNITYVIIDTPPTPSIWMTSALIASQHYLIPVKPDPLSINGINLLRSVVEEKKDAYDIGLSCLGVVLTMTEANTTTAKEARDYLENEPFFKKHIYKADLPKRVRIAKTQTQQRYIFDLQNNHDLKMALARIVAELCRRIDNE